MKKFLQRIPPAQRAKFKHLPQGFVSSLGVSEDAINRNIIKINDMVNDIEYCKNCKGIEKSGCAVGQHHPIEQIPFAQLQGSCVVIEFLVQIAYGLHGIDEYGPEQTAAYDKKSRRPE